jgi:hypothetical protein
MIATDVSEESKTPNESEGAWVCCGTRDCGKAFDTGDYGIAICAGNEVMIPPDTSDESKSPDLKESEPVAQEIKEEFLVLETAEQLSVSETRSQ